jgi:hypothetical protein
VHHRSSSPQDYAPSATSSRSAQAFLEGAAASIIGLVILWVFVEPNSGVGLT